MNTVTHFVFTVAQAKSLGEVLLKGVAEIEANEGQKNNIRRVNCIVFQDSEMGDRSSGPWGMCIKIVPDSMNWLNL